MTKGFTLIEILLVAAVMAILLATTLPNFQRASQRLQLETAAFHLAQQFRYAHQESVARQEDIVWRWDESEQRSRLYAVTDEAGEPVIAPLAEQRLASAPLANLQAGAVLTRDGDVLACDDDRLVNGCSRCACIRFHPDGTVQDGTTIPVNLVVRQHDLTYTIRVEAATSRVSLVQGAAVR